MKTLRQRWLDALTNPYWWAIGVGLLAWTQPARADTGLAQVCALGSGPTTECVEDDGTTQRVWARPSPDDAVAVCHLADSTNCLWSTSRYEIWSTIPDTSFIHICLLDLTPGQAAACPGDANKPWTPKADVLDAEDVTIINGQGTITLRWNPPTQRMDGSTLSPNEISGYRVEWGQTLDPPDGTFDVSEGGATTSVFTLPLSETAEILFAMRTRDSDDQLSERSNAISRTFILDVTEDIPDPPNPPQSLEVDVTVTCVAADGFTCTFTVQ